MPHPSRCPARPLAASRSWASRRLTLVALAPVALEALVGLVGRDRLLIALGRRGVRHRGPDLRPHALDEVLAGAAPGPLRLELELVAERLDVAVDVDLHEAEVGRTDRARFPPGDPVQRPVPGLQID